MQDTACLVVVIVGALRRKLWEVPEAVVGAWHDDVCTGHGVEECRAISAVAIGVSTRDLGEVVCTFLTSL